VSSGVVNDGGGVEEGSSVDKRGVVDNWGSMNNWGNTDGVHNWLNSPHDWNGVVDNGLNGPDNGDGMMDNWCRSDKGGPGVGVVGWGIDRPHNWSWGDRDDWLVNGDNFCSRGSVGES